jgi:hypothetical protein
MTDFNSIESDTSSSARKMGLPIIEGNIEDGKF